MKRFILVLAILLLLPLTSLADPSPGISWLQREPLTLFDYGLQRADQSFEDSLKRGSWRLRLALLDGYMRDTQLVNIVVEGANRGLTKQMSHKRQLILREAIRRGIIVSGEDGKLKRKQPIGSKKQSSIPLSKIVEYNFSDVQHDFEKNKLLFKTLIIIKRAELDIGSLNKEFKEFFENQKLEKRLRQLKDSIENQIRKDNGSLESQKRKDKDFIENQNRKYEDFAKNHNRKAKEEKEKQEIENQIRESLVNSDTCELLLELIKQGLMNDMGLTGEIHPEEDWFGIIFSHSGFKNKSRPKSLERELVRISEITVHLGFISMVALSGRSPVSCSMPFAGGPISVTKNTKF